MSMWTHITAVIHVDTCIFDDNIEEEFTASLKDAPKIIGAEMFVNIRSVYSLHVYSDCDKCPYCIGIDDEHMDCNKPIGAECVEGKYGSLAVITIVGDLRNKTKEQVKQEFDDFVRYLRMSGCIIRSQACNIEQ